MADSYGAARSNYFLVKDPDAFKAWVASQPGLKLFTNDGKFGVHTLLEDGSCPSQVVEESDPFAPEPSFEEVLAPFLADGEVGVLMECASQKNRYVSGSAVAFDNTGKTATLMLSDIYDLAQAAFGVRPTPAEQ